VGHAAQLVRRECYEAIGGYALLKYGGEDWYAQTCARIKGWKVEAVPELKIFHHRHTGTSNHPIRNAFRSGQLDYSFGSDPVFEALKCLRRFRESPYVIGGMIRFAGFVWPYMVRDARAVPEDFMAFLREEQRSRVSALLGVDKWFATKEGSDIA
jgi:hypothetical protein